MLISHKHRFIFVHIYKTGGTSITAALMPFAASPLTRLIGRVIQPFGFEQFGPRPCPKHASAAAIAEQLGQKVFDDYFTFAFVRNPWDWQVSLYKYLLRSKPNPDHERVKAMADFDEYIRWRCDGRVREQYELICDGAGNALVDYVGRFERLDEDFAQACQRIGIDASLKQLNPSRGRKPYPAYYTDETAALVRTHYARDIERFGYEFEA